MAARADVSPPAMIPWWPAKQLPPTTRRGPSSSTSSASGSDRPSATRPRESTTSDPPPSQTWPGSRSSTCRSAWLISQPSVITGPGSRAAASSGAATTQSSPSAASESFRPGDARTHIHVRQFGSFDGQAALLFRDCLRSRADQADRYAAVKREHSHLLATDRQAYVEAKAPTVWQLLQRADVWGQLVRWERGVSDW